MKFVPFALLFVLMGQVLTGKARYEYISPDSIPELQYLDTSVDPCDNFYQYTCGNFRNVKPKPDGEYIWDHFVILQQEIHSTMRLILDSQRKSEDPVALQKAKSAYKSCLDTEYSDVLTVPHTAVMEELGVWPLITNDEGDVEPITMEEIGGIVARYGVPLFFRHQVLPNYYDVADNIIYMYRDALSNPQTYYPTFQPDLEDYLDSPAFTRANFDGSEKVVTPFEQFLRTVAFRLRDVEGTFRSDEAIKSDLSETINFMVKLQSGGITDPELSRSAFIVTVRQLQEWTEEHFGDNGVRFAI